MQWRSACLHYHWFIKNVSATLSILSLVAFHRCWFFLVYCIHFFNCFHFNEFCIHKVSLYAHLRIKFRVLLYLPHTGVTVSTFTGWTVSTSLKFYRIRDLCLIMSSFFFHMLKQSISHWRRICLLRFISDLSSYADSGLMRQYQARPLVVCFHWEYKWFSQTKVY